MNEGPSAKPSHAIEWLVWGLVAATVIAIGAAFVVHRFGGEQLHKPLTVAGEVPAFTLTNQFGQPLSNTDLRGSVWVADVIFSRCPVSCEQMTRRMRAVQDEFGNRAGVKRRRSIVSPWMG
jgi:cytochrome oxidase Cu insertion factor (SCO1/SenC/PrrC family)